VILRFCLGCSFPQCAPKVGLVIHLLQGSAKCVQGIQIGDRWLGFTQLEGLGNASLLMGFVRVVEEDVRFPGLFPSSSCVNGTNKLGREVGFGSW
jgi:hypothetical protein